MPTYRFSPKGHRVGTILIGSEQGLLELTVVPKFWRGEMSAKAEENKPKNYRLENCGSFAVFEGDTLQVDTNVFGVVCERLDRLASGGHKDEDGARTHAGLISSDTRCRSNTQVLRESEPNSSQADSALLALMLLDDRLDRRSDAAGLSEYQQESAEWTAWAGASELTVLKLLLAGWRLVRAVERHINKLRKGYRAEEIVSDGPRGRVLPRGFVRMASTGMPSLDCEVDTLSEVMPLSQVLVTTLELMATHGWSARLQRFRDSRLVKDTERRAARLRRYLHSIPAVNREEAVRLCSTLRLPPLQRVFESTLRDCRALLTSTPPRQAQGNPDNAPDFVLWFDTARLWESLLLQGFNQFGGYSAMRGVDEKPEIKEGWKPWQGLPQKEPDILVNVPMPTGEPDRVVVDAKYREYAGAPKSDEQYQIYAYSHVVEVVRQVLLLYPAPRYEKKGTWRRNDCRNDNNVRACDDTCIRLTAATLPFPSREECLEDGAWEKYMLRLKSGCRSLLEGLTSTESTNPSPLGGTTLAP